MAAAFAMQASRALARGILHGYVRREESSLTVRGRIRFDEQVRFRHGRFPPLEIAYDDFTPDVIENRLLKAAIARLVGLPIRQRDIWLRLRHVQARLDPVALVHYGAGDVPTIQYTRLNQYYRPAVELARLILRRGSLRATAGSVQGPGLLIDMNQLYQDFVEVAIREALRGDGVEAQRQDRSRTLDYRGRVPLAPDLTFRQGGSVTLVGDAKHKRAASSGPPNADMYQALAYATAFDVRDCVLIYPANEALETSHDIRHTQRRVLIRTLDLSASPAELLRRVSRLAEELCAISVQESWRKPATAVDCSHEPAGPDCH